MEAKVWKKIS